ncbi:hypothetical protein GW17_00056491, partial [Ensete ventricosum]
MPPSSLSGHCWFKPLCANLPVVVSGRSRCSTRWMDPSYPVTGVGCWSGGARIRRRHLRSGRALAPARRSGRVSSRRDPSDDQVSFVVDFSIPLPCRGVGAYIVGVVGYSYLATLLPLWLTMPSYPSTTPIVLAMRHASAGKGVDLTCVRSVVRPLAPPYLHPANFPRRVGHVGGPIVRGREDLLARGGSRLVPSGSSGTDQTKQELRNLNGAGADPTEQELGNLNGARDELTEQELGNWNGAGDDPTEQELGNWNGAGVDPTEHELGN